MFVGLNSNLPNQTVSLSKSLQSDQPENGRPNTRPRFRPMDFVFLGLVILLGSRIITIAGTRGFENDFAHYYVSSRVLLTGHQDVYRIDLEPEYKRLNWHQMDEPVFRASNPPALLWLFGAFAIFPPNIAFFLWITFQVACLVAIYALTKRLLRERLSDDHYKMAVTAFLVLPIVEAHFHYSQVQLLLVVLVLGGYFLLKKGHAISACSLIVFASLLKLFPLILLPWFIWKGGDDVRARFKLAGWSTGFLVLGLGASGVLLWKEFFEVASQGISVWAKSFPSYSIASFFAKFGIVASGSNASVLTNALFYVGLSVSAVLILVTYPRILSGRRNSDLELSILLLLMLLCGTTCWLHYLVFLFFPICCCLSLLLRHQQANRLGTMGWAFAAVVFLMLHTSLMEIPSGGIAKLIVTNLPFFSMSVMFAFLFYKGRNEQRGNEQSATLVHNVA